MASQKLSPFQMLLTIFAGTFTLSYAILRQLPISALPSFVSARPLLSCALVAVFVAEVDRLILWPFLRSPLRQFPTIDRHIEPLLLCLESPRGRTAQKWISQFPEADVIHVRIAAIGGEVLLPVTPEGFKDIMGSAAYALEKPTGMKKALATVLGYGLILTEGDEHKRQRKALTPAFGLNNIRGLYPLMWQKSQEFAARVGDEAATKGFIEVSSWASKLTLDIIGHAALSQDFKTMSNQESEICKAFEFILFPTPIRQLHFVATLLLPFTLLSNIPAPYNIETKRHNAVLRSTCERFLAQKKQALKDGTIVDETDMMRDIITSNAFNDRQIVDQMLTFLAAGHETTAMALTWSCYAMAKNPDLQAALNAELCEQLPPDASSVSQSTFDAMPYLNGVCEEVTRLYPTVPATIRLVKQRTVIAGVEVPEETIIAIVPYAINRNPRFWGPDATEFKPERWIDVAADGSKRSNKHGGTDSNLCGMTFLHGNRSCIGMNFAKAELKCAVASLFSQYEVSMWDPDEEIKIVGSVTTRPDVGMKIKLKKRVSR